MKTKKVIMVLSAFIIFNCATGQENPNQAHPKVISNCTEWKLHVDELYNNAIKESSGAIGHGSHFDEKADDYFYKYLGEKEKFLKVCKNN